MTIIPPEMITPKRLCVAAHYTKLINDNRDWDLAGIYAEQESGVSVSKRNELGRFLCDCEDGLIDMILMKSLSCSMPC